MSMFVITEVICERVNNFWHRKVNARVLRCLLIYPCPTEPARKFPNFSECQETLPYSTPLFSLKFKRPLELYKDMPREHGDLGCVTHAGLPCLLLQSQQA